MTGGDQEWVQNPQGEGQLGSGQSLPIRVFGSLFLLVFFNPFIIGFLFSYVHSVFLESFLITDFEKDAVVPQEVEFLLIDRITVS
jgi:hypothetical protein